MIGGIWRLLATIGGTLVLTINLICFFVNYSIHAIANQRVRLLVR
jgi:hypothetical protein